MHIAVKRVPEYDGVYVGTARKMAAKSHDRQHSVDFVKDVSWLIKIGRRQFINCPDHVKIKVTTTVARHTQEMWRILYLSVGYCPVHKAGDATNFLASNFAKYSPISNMPFTSKFRSRVAVKMPLNISPYLQPVAKLSRDSSVITTPICQ